MEALPYHRLARASDNYRWWRPLVELVTFCVLVIAAWLVVFPVLIERLGDADAGAAGIIKIGLVLGVALPVAFIAARIAGRPAGTLSSVAGRVRWRWLAICALVALAMVVVSIATTSIASALGVTTGPPRGGWVGFEEFLPLAAAVVCVIPIQAAAEEYAFRGVLMQAVGAWIPLRWIAIAISALLFGFAHGLGIQGFVAITGFGVVTAWLAIRTGGLEAAIAYHVINNVSLFLFDAATGRGGVWVSELNQHITWVATAVDLAISLLYAVVITRLARRRQIAATVISER